MGEPDRWLALARAYGGLAVFCGVFLESVVLPIPSPPFIIAAAALLVPTQGGWQAAFVPMLWRIALPGALGSTLGTSVIFALFWWGGKPVIARYGRLLGVDWSGVSAMEKRLEGRADLMVFVTRVLPLFPLGLVSAAAGVLRLPAPGFVVWTFAGALLRCIILGYTGFLTRGTYETAAAGGSALKATALLGALFLSPVLFALWAANRGKRRR
jgi:membrane protein DedA with SNARE-associated domain